MKHFNLHRHITNELWKPKESKTLEKLQSTELKPTKHYRSQLKKCRGSYCCCNVLPYTLVIAGVPDLVSPILLKKVANLVKATITTNVSSKRSSLLQCRLTGFCSGSARRLEIVVFPFLQRPKM